MQMSTTHCQQRSGTDRMKACLLVSLAAAALACAGGDTRTADTGTAGGVVGDTTAPPATTPATPSEQPAAAAADSTPRRTTPAATTAAAKPAASKPAAAKTPAATSAATSAGTTAAKPAATQRSATDSGAARGTSAGATVTAKVEPAAASSAGASTGGQGSDSLLASQAEYNGWKTYHVYCYRCHGVEAMGSDIAPNLRESLRTHVTHDVFIDVVTNGRIEKGMPAWKELLTKDKMEEVYAYLKARSDGRLKPGRPHTAQE
jgi:mono/diheme cytochrome c family protein